jgi:hypothetical protein
MPGFLQPYQIYRKDVTMFTRIVAADDAVPEKTLVAVIVIAP